MQKPISWLEVVGSDGLSPFRAEDGTPVSEVTFPVSSQLLRGIMYWRGRLLQAATEDTNPEHIALQGRMIAVRMKNEMPDTVIVHTPVAGAAATSEIISKEVAEEAARAANWPEGMYLHSFCAICAMPFMGPKREVHCCRCDEKYVAKSRPHTVFVFGGEDAPSGVTPEMLPEDAPIIATTFFAGTRDLVRVCFGKTEILDFCVILRSLKPSGATGEVFDATRKVPETDMGTPLHERETRRSLRAMIDAPRDGTPILLRFRFDIAGDLPGGFSGTVIVGCNHRDRGSLDAWEFAAPIGQTGFPDSMFQGWAPISEGVAGI